MLRRAAPITLIFASALALGCSGAADPTPIAPAAPSSSAVAPPSSTATATTTATADATAAVATAAPKAPSLAFVEDDLLAATKKARAEGKALFVDAWAPWCHTCLSMKHYVLSDPSLAPLAERVVFAAIDTDRPESAEFLARHAVKAWPTFFVIDPARDAVVGYWAGSASVAEIRGLVEEGLGAMGQGSAKSDEASKAFLEARKAHAAGDPARASKSYEKAVRASAPDWANRSAAILGWIQTTQGARAWADCVRIGVTHLTEIRGASLPSDAAAYTLMCAEELPKGKAQDEAKARVIEHLRAFSASPPAGASVDDRADALATLADALAGSGDAAGAKKAHADRLALMEAAARAARTPEEAQTYDYGRANAYVALGRADEAIAMLAQREKEMPSAYEPPARLADVLARAGRHTEALAAAERALAKAYGPRKLRYLKLRAEIQQRMGDRAAAIATLREEVKGWEALPPGQGGPQRIAEAKRRLADAERGTTPGARR